MLVCTKLCEDDYNDVPLYSSMFPHHEELEDEICEKTEDRVYREFVGKNKLHN